MKLLILTQYYPPEIGAPQNRLHELAVRLKKSGVEVEVLTALPNYPVMEVFPEYRDKKKREEIIDGIPVHRAWIYVSKSKGIVARLLNYFSFVWTSYRRGRKLHNFDFLMVESPPLFLGYSAMRLSKTLNAKLIFNVSDLWPESAEKLGIVSNRLLLKMAYRLEAKCYRKATLITGQTLGIVEDIKQRFPDKEVYWLPNGVDLGYYDPEQLLRGKWRQAQGFKEDELLIFYGGILGHAQGLEVLIKAAAMLKGKPVTFIIQGDGPERANLIELNREIGNDHVIFREPVQKSEMPQILRDVDVAVIPLKKLDLFKGAIPSKVFESLAMRKAILLGVEGEAKMHFVDRAGAALFFEPENAESLVAQVAVLLKNRTLITELGEKGRSYAAKVFDRDHIAQEFLSKISAVFNAK